MTELRLPARQSCVRDGTRRWPSVKGSHPSPAAGKWRATQEAALPTPGALPVPSALLLISPHLPSGPGRESYCHHLRLRTGTLRHWKEMRCPNTQRGVDRRLHPQPPRPEHQVLSLAADAHSGQTVPNQRPLEEIHGCRQKTEPAEGWRSRYFLLENMRSATPRRRSPSSPKDSILFSAKGRELISKCVA